MQQVELEQFLNGLKGSERSYPFGPEALVYKVKHKMFALVGLHENRASVSLKCLPADAEMLCSEFQCIVPGYHLNKKHWITISLTDELPDEMLVALVEGSYKLIVSKLTKADKKQLG